MFKTVSLLSILAAAVLSTGCAITPPTKEEVAHLVKRGHLSGCEEYADRCTVLQGKALERAQTEAKVSATSMPAPKAFR